MRYWAIIVLVRLHAAGIVAKRRVGDDWEYAKRLHRIQLDSNNYLGAHYQRISAHYPFGHSQRGHTELIWRGK